MSKKKRILFLPKWYPNKLVPANGNFVAFHADAVARHCDVDVLFVRSTDQQKERFNIEKSKENNVNVVRVYFRKPVGWLRLFYILTYFKAQKLGYRELSKPDVCHVHVLKRSSIFALYLKITQRIPYVITEHWSGYTSENGKFGGALNTWITKYLVGKSTFITTVSDYLQQAMKKHGIKGNFKIVPNAVDVEMFQRIEAKKQSDSIKFIHISTLEERVKNVSGILKAAQKLSREGHVFELHFLGDGPDKPKQEELAKELGLMKFTHFHGDLDRSLVAQHMKSSDALVLFSHYETQSVVMLEAFCCGIPVIAPAVGGIVEHLNHSRGVLIQPNDQIGLANAMRQIIHRELSFDSLEINKYGVENFSEHFVGKAFNEIYDSALKQKHG